MVTSEAATLIKVELMTLWINLGEYIYARVSSN